MTEITLQNKPLTLSFDISRNLALIRKLTNDPEVDDLSEEIDGSVLQHTRECILDSYRPEEVSLKTVFKQILHTLEIGQVLIDHIISRVTPDSEGEYEMTYFQFYSFCAIASENTSRALDSVRLASFLCDCIAGASSVPKENPTHDKNGVPLDKRECSDTDFDS